MGIDHISEVVSLIEVEWLCYGGVSLMEGKRHVRFIGGRMVMLWRWTV